MIHEILRELKEGALDALRLSAALISAPFVIAREFMTRPPRGTVPLDAGKRARCPRWPISRVPEFFEKGPTMRMHGGAGSPREDSGVVFCRLRVTLR